MSEPEATLHIRLNERSLQTLKDRARSRQLPLSAYTAMILRYLALLDEPIDRILLATRPDPQELYVSASLPSLLRSRWSSRSERCPCSLATFAGICIGRFLERSVRDPGDLDMLCHLGELLDRKPLLSDTDLEAVIRRAIHTPVARMPAPYQVRWYHARLQPWLAVVEWQGQPLPFTTEQVTAILGRIRR